MTVPVDRQSGSSEESLGRADIAPANLPEPHGASLTEKDHAHIWHPFTAMHNWIERDPLIIESGSGVFLKDVIGREYYDGNSSLWVNVHGHRHPRIDEAIREQLNQIAHSTFLGLTNPLAIQLAEQLAALAPGELNRVFYSDSGSEAVEIALKIAFQHWQLRGEPQRTEYLTLANGYHGDTLGAVSVGGIPAFHGLFRPLLFKTHWATVDTPDLKQTLDRFIRMLHENHSRLAAVIMEPSIQAAAGMLLMPPGFLKGVELACHEFAVPLIIDEIATGFGRTGRMFACEHEAVHPDLMCIAKGLTGGYLPLAATLVTDAIFEPFLGENAVFYHGHSYTANALGCAAALANLSIFRDEQVLDTLAPRIEHVRTRLRRFKDLSHVRDVRQFGMMIGIEIRAPESEAVGYGRDLTSGSRVCLRCRELGMITRALGDVVVFLPPLSATIPQLDAMLEILYQSIIDVTGV